MLIILIILFFEILFAAPFNIYILKFIIIEIKRFSTVVDIREKTSVSILIILN